MADDAKPAPAPKWQYLVQKAQDEAYGEVYRRAMSWQAAHGDEAGENEQALADHLFGKEAGESDARISPGQSPKQPKKPPDDEAIDRIARNLRLAKAGATFSGMLLWPPELPTIGEALSHLGRDGWELVAALPTEQKEPRRVYRLILKRPQP